MPGSPDDVAPLSAIDLKRLLDRGEPVVLLDVREDFERDLCALPAGSGVVDLHVPMGQIPGRVAEIVEAAAGGPLVVYCHHGQRSMVVALWLAARGVADLRNLDGGIDAWSLGVDPSVPRY